MENFILLLSNNLHDKYIDELNQYMNEQNLGDFSIIREDNIESAYDHLFKAELSLVIGDITLEGGKEALQMIKTEEMSKHIPIAVLIGSEDDQTICKAYQAGADAVITDLDIEKNRLPYICRPLVMNNQLLCRNINKLSGLQDKAINDFILLDLIKAYIPKTIWEIALDCAHQQKMYIAEEETEKTIVFGDIIGFTKMTQHIDPKKVIATLNEAYNIVTEIIYKYKGDIDKFVGDAFIGIFDDPSAAVKSSIEIQKKIAELNQQREAEQKVPIRFRIGINTGPVIRGNVGGNQRYDNTLIGDAVNTASRFEHIAPEGDIVISESTKIKAGLTIPAEHRHTTTLRGKDTVDIYYTVFEYLKENVI
jgi:class 3 adenylate cyclase